MDEELKKLLQKTLQKAQPPQKLHLQGPGPFELPLVDDASLQHHDQQIVLELHTAGAEQTVRVHLTREALKTLGLLATGFLSLQPSPKNN